MSPPLGRNRRQRRRRAAVVGGVAYEAGKRRAQNQEPEPAAEAEPAAEPAPPASAGGLSPEAMTQLKELAELHESGALTDEEFAQQKAKLLGG